MIKADSPAVKYHLNVSWWATHITTMLPRAPSASVNPAKWIQRTGGSGQSLFSMETASGFTADASGGHGPSVFGVAD